MYQECRHIMPNGVRCQSPALRGTAYCYFHTRLHRLAAEQSSGQDEPLKLSVLEDRSSIQIALAQVHAIHRDGASDRGVIINDKATI